MAKKLKTMQQMNQSFETELSKQKEQFNTDLNNKIKELNEVKEEYEKLKQIKTDLDKLKETHDALQAKYKKLYDRCKKEKDEKDKLKKEHVRKK
eukprot:UN32473